MAISAAPALAGLLRYVDRPAIRSHYRSKGMGEELDAAILEAKLQLDREHDRQPRKRRRI